MWCLWLCLGNNDVAYTTGVGLDQTCAICVPCFQNGNHKGHDYSIIYTGDGCCDCGQSVGSVLNALFNCWKTQFII